MSLSLTWSHFGFVQQCTLPWQMWETIVIAFQSPARIHLSWTFLFRLSQTVTLISHQTGWDVVTTLHQGRKMAAMVALVCWYVGLVLVNPLGQRIATHCVFLCEPPRLFIFLTQSSLPHMSGGSNYLWRQECVLEQKWSSENKVHPFMWWWEEGLFQTPVSSQIWDKDSNSHNLTRAPSLCLLHAPPSQLFCYLNLKFMLRPQNRFGATEPIISSSSQYDHIEDIFSLLSWCLFNRRTR